MSFKLDENNEIFTELLERHKYDFKILNMNNIEDIQQVSETINLHSDTFEKINLLSSKIQTQNKNKTTNNNNTNNKNKKPLGLTANKNFLFLNKKLKILIS
mgnify:CR=1 FL=1